MSKDAFWEKVVEDVKERLSPEEAAELRKPENLDKWREYLLQFKKDLERQAASRKSNYFEDIVDARKDPHRSTIISADYFRWKSAVQPIFKSVETRLREVKLLRKKQSGYKDNYQKDLWRLINMAEIVIDKGHIWHDELSRFRRQYKKSQEEV